MGVAAVSLTACQGLGMYSALDSAQLRVVDASPDAGVIDSYGNNAALAYNLTFGTVTNYIAVAPGVYQLAADRAGSRQTLVAGTETLAAGKQYTEIIGSSLANMRQTIFLDQATPAPEREIALRVVNETTRPGALNIYAVSMTSSDGRARSSTPLAVNLCPGASSGYIVMPMGTYAIDVTPTSAPLSSVTATLLSGAQLPYPSGAVRTVVLIDQQSPGTQQNPGSQQNAPQTGVQAIVADDADAP